MAKTVIGMMDRVDEARAAVRELVSSGIQPDDIGFMANERHALTGTAALNEAEGVDAHSGLMDSLERLGLPEEQARRYAEGVRRGGILVTVAASSDAEADRAISIMQERGPVIEEKPRPKPASRGLYRGPERRSSTRRWLGEERRRRAA